MDFSGILLAVQGSADGAAKGGNWMTIIMMVIVFALMYFILIRPQSQQEKKDKAMRNALKPGDEIVTQGGILGRIVTIKEDSLVIETAADRTKLRITRGAVLQNITANEKAEENRRAAIDASKAEKENKKLKKNSDKSDAKKEDKKADKAEEKTEDKK